MANNDQERLKAELLVAIKNNNQEEINRISKLLNVPDDQIKYFSNGLTGYPSIDKVWLKQYPEGAENTAMNIPTNKTVWDVVEEQILEYYDIPALVYFGKEISRPEFRDLCYMWARTFRAMGIAPGDVVPVYGPFVPDICAMVFAFNMIGACPYFLKLTISPEALAEETKDSSVAVVYDGMWANVAGEFSKDRFKKVLVASISSNMPSPKKEIVSFISKIQARKQHFQIPNEKKYVTTEKALEIADYYTGEVKVPFIPNRNTFITSSSGTTVGGIVKGTVATNESTISQLYMGKASGIQYYPGDKILNNFPPTASTSLNALFLLGLYFGETIYVDPRVNEKAFYNQIMTLMPNIVLTTGSFWEIFFNKIKKEIEAGKTPDLSFAKGWTIGGEGTDCYKFQLWNSIMRLCGAKGIYSGYGSSELFSAVSVETLDARYDFSKPIMSVGIPYAGITMGVFDENGNELPYNQRGELRIKSKSAMKEYYNKPELTAKTKVDGWIRTGDLGEIDEKGFIYVWGRVSDKFKLSNDKELYLFDVANVIKNNSFISDAVVLSMPTIDNPNNLVAHIAWRDEEPANKKELIEILNDQLFHFLPEGITLSAYAEHGIMLPYSPTTLKKDKNAMSKQTTGYIQVIDGELNNVEFILNNDGKYSQNCAIIKEGKIKTLRK